MNLAAKCSKTGANPMKPRHLLLIASIAAVAVSALSATGALANDRYATPPPVVMSPDLAAPWVMQLQNAPVGQRGVQNARRITAPQAASPQIAKQRSKARQYREAAYQRPTNPAKPAVAPRQGMDPKFLPQKVDYSSGHAAGTIVIDTAQKFLYLVEGNGKAQRYGVGVGKQGFGWKGSETVSRKAEWPSWHPPQEMIARERKKGNILPARMEGGLANPLGARALYLGSTLYRIHGTNAPSTIGKAVSSGCIRMRNQDVEALYERVKVGAKVIVR